MISEVSGVYSFLFTCKVPSFIQIPLLPQIIYILGRGIELDLSLARGVWHARLQVVATRLFIISLDCLQVACLCLQCNHYSIALARPLPSIRLSLPVSRTHEYFIVTFSLVTLVWYPAQPVISCIAHHVT